MIADSVLAKSHEGHFMTLVRWTAVAAVAIAGCTISVAATAAETSRNWGGFYLGALIGYGFGKAPTNVTPYGAAAGWVTLPYYVSDLEPHPRGVTGGIEAGYNHQVGRAVLGVAADISFGSMSRTESGTAIPYVGGTLTTTVENKIDWYGTLRAKLGFLPTDNLHVYLTGGLAYGHTETTMIGSNINCPSKLYCMSGSSSGTSTGGVVGAGLEYAISSQWSLKAEYLAMKLGSRSLNLAEQPFSGVPGGYTVSTDFKLQTVRAGLTYRFGN